ncbi:aa_trans domain-containing protein [Nephila pilipes]|uniref:Aa_trans domain-containing protein n=1 Tax=Nephila pilipes TaxID=299642 RepID=A0A8X6P7W4_NEPPI|nr:aa_trans domain-containing protein [Nephila pilipes]GFT56594.1 aa_trans domain-containing protein [Nephila pilipes]
MQDIWPKYKERNMIPYPEIGFRAVGNWMRYLVITSQIVSQLSLAIGYLVNIARHIEYSSAGKLKFCDMMILSTFFMIPFTWFRSPKNFWFLAVIDVVCNLLYMVLVLFGIFVDKQTVGPVKYPQSSFSTFALSFGSLMFAYSGGGVYPTIQNDMKDSKLFLQSLFTGFLVIYSIYVPLAILGYAAYGELTKQDITINLLQNSNLRGTARFLQFLSLTQLATTTVIYLNPTFQILEYYLYFPKRFGYQRCLLRSGVLLAVFFIAFATPLVIELSQVLAIIFVGLLTCVYPAVFYACLVRKRTTLSGIRKINLKSYAFLSGMILLGLLGSISAFYTSGYSISQKKNLFSMNCFSTSNVNMSYLD